MSGDMHGFWWAPSSWAFDVNDGGAPPDAGRPAQPERQTQFRNVSAAVAELERRESERRAESKAKKAAKAVGDTDEQGNTLEVADGRLRGPEADIPDEPKPKAKPKAQAKEDADIDADDGDDEDEDPVDKALAEHDGDEDSPGDDDGVEATDDDAEDDPEERTTVDIDGKKLEIPKGTPKALVDAVKRMSSELKADYTRKTQETAEAQRVATAHAQAAEGLLQQVQSAQAAVVQMAQRMVGQPPPLALLQSDPQSYMLQKELHEQRVRDLGQLTQVGRQMSAQAQQQQQQRAEQQRQASLQAEAQRMVQALPKLANPEARKTFMAEAAGLTAQFGFTPQDVSTIGDHRMLRLLDRLVTLERRESARQKAAGSVKSKLDNVPPRMLKPGASAANLGKGDRASQAKQQFMKSGRTLKDVKRFLASTS